MQRLTAYSIKKHIKFDKKEFTDFFTYILLLTVIVFLWRWRYLDLDVNKGIILFLLLYLCFFLSLFVYVISQKIVALNSGYFAKYENSFFGFIFCLFITFYTAGFLLCLYPGSVILEHSEKMRLGKFRYGINIKDIAKVAFFGPIANLIIVFVLGLFYINKIQSPFLHVLISINLMIAAFSLLPFPKLAGIHIFFFSIPLWIFIFVSVWLFGFIFVVFDKYMPILSIFIAIIMVILYHLYFKERL
ncbi:MAG: hypothetical protein QXG00_00580 [Candidatus Woesearchaeota archaeon]